MFLLAQLQPDTDVASISLELARQTVAAWEQTWELVISPDSQLWQNLVDIGLFLATITILWIVMTEGKDAVERQSFSDLIRMIAVPLVVAMFLSNSGTPLATLVLAIRGYSHAQVQQVLEIQVGNDGMGESVSKVATSSAVVAQVDALFAECGGKTGPELEQCSLQKIGKAQRILEDAESRVGPLPEVRQKIQTFAGGPGGGESNPATDFAGDMMKALIINVIKGILWALQWGFVNLLEVSLLLTALLAPVAMGLSLLPIQGRPIFAWLIGFMSLFGMQLSYNILTGLVATVLIQSQASVAGDLGFLMFLALLSPLLCTTMMSMSGVAIFNAVSFSTSALARSVAASAWSGSGWAAGKIANQFKPLPSSTPPGGSAGSSATGSTGGSSSSSGGQFGV